MIEVTFLTMILSENDDHDDLECIEKILSRRVLLPTIKLDGIDFEFDTDLFCFSTTVEKVGVAVSEDGSFKVFAVLDDWYVTSYSKEVLENYLKSLLDSGWSIE